MYQSFTPDTPEQEEQTDLELWKPAGELLETYWSPVVDKPDFKVDPSFKLTDESNKDIWEGISIRTQEEIAAAAPTSRDEALYIRNGAIEREEAENRLASQGKAGMAALVASQLVTPSGVFTELASMGAGTVFQLAKAGKFGVDAMRLASDATFAQKALALGAVDTVAWTTSGMATDPLYSKEDAMQDALIGAAMFSTVAGISKGYRTFSKADSALPDAINKDISNYGSKESMGSAGSSARLDTEMPERDNYVDSWRLSDLYHQGMKLESETGRSFVNKLLQDGVVVRKDSYQQAVTADIAAERKFSSLLRETSTKTEPLVNNYFKSKGIGMFSNPRRKTQAMDELESSLYEHLVKYERDISEIPDENIRAIANLWFGNGGLMSKGLDAARKGGVEGMESLTHSANYIPRRINEDMLKRLNKGSGSAAADIKDALFQGMKNKYRAYGNDKITDSTMKAMARAMYDRYTKLTPKNVPMRTHMDESDLREMLRDANLPEDQIDEALNAHYYEPEPTEGGRKITQANARIPLDLTVEIKGAGSGYQLGDIFQKNMFDLASRYSHSSIGNGELASRGFKSLTELDSTINKAAQEVLDKTGSKTKAQEAREYYEKIVSAVQGVPLIATTNTSESLLRGIRRAQAAATLQMLGTMGIAAIPEGMAVAMRMGLDTLFEGMPVLRKWSSVDRKALLDDFAEHNLYFGNPRFEGRFTNIHDTGVEGIAAKEGAWGVYDRAMHDLTTGKYGLVNASFLGPIDKFYRETVAVGLAKDLMRTAKRGKSKMKFHRNEAGWTEEQHKQILKYINSSKTKRTLASGKQVDHFDINQWRTPDGELDEKMIDIYLDGTYKFVSSKILRGTIGESYSWAEGPLAAIFLQFRRLVLTSVNKMTRSAIANKDQATALELLGGTLGIVLANELKVAAKSLGGDEYDENADKLSITKNISQLLDTGNTQDLRQSLVYSLGYHPSMGPVVDIAGMVSGFMVGEDASGRRSTMGDQLFSTPVLGLGENIAKGLYNTVKDGEVDIDHLRYAVPLQNTITGYAVFNGLKQLQD